MTYNPLTSPRLYDNDSKRDLIEKQLLQAESDVFYHNSMMELAKAAGDEATEKQQQEYLEKADKVARASVEILDKLPPKKEENVAKDKDK